MACQMIKLRKLNARGFRGARFDLSVDFGENFSSVAVYGDNAAGKSTIADALEWLLLGTVRHLWREGCKEESLRNILLNASELSEVDVELGPQSTPYKKALDATFKTISSKLSKNLLELLKNLQNERIFLRHSQITEFVAKTKSEKKEEIAAIIGYQEILDFREAVQSARNALAKDGDYISAKHRVESASQRLLKRSGTVIVSKSQLYAYASKYIEQFGLITAITDASSYSDVVQKLKGQIGNPDRAEQKLRLGELRTDCDAFQARKDEIVAELEKFSSLYAYFAENKDAATKIKIEHFLSVGRSLIQNGDVTDDLCPFCLEENELKALESQVGERIAEIVTLRSQFDHVTASRNEIRKLTAAARTICGRIADKYEGLGPFDQLINSATPTLSALSTVVSEIEDKFDAIQPISSFSGQVGALTHFATLAKTYSNKIDSAIGSLNISAEELKLIDGIDLLRDLDAQVNELEAGLGVRRAFENQIFTLSSVLDQFLAVQNNALQVVLDRIGQDVGHFYGKLHPAENVDKIRLRVVGENGIEFEYEFHGTPAQPPMKYLSESHLNSLGICLFLASAKLFNKSSRFLVLDDIVTSFDVNHRRRLLRLLKDEFADWQIILLTHEHLWFDMTKKEMAQGNWRFKEVEWDAENGIRLDESAVNLRLFIDEKRKKYDVSNDVRKLIESTAKEICHALEVKLPFRFNDDNERRMSGELLSELRGTVSRKCASLKGHPIFQQLEGSSLVANVGSHDNPTEKVADGDIDVALADIDKLISLFKCPHCKRFVEASRRLSGKDKISCKCGKTELDWKD